jgi:hypothetical protein
MEKDIVVDLEGREGAEYAGNPSPETNWARELGNIWDRLSFG